MLNKKTLKQMFLVIIGQMVLGFGLAWIISAGLGLDPFSVFHDGIAKVFGISLGTAMFFESLVALVAIVFIDRKYINFATVVSLFLVGFTADKVVTIITSVIPANVGFLVQLFMLLLGAVILATGLNIYILADLGAGALDAIAEMITDKSKYEYKVVKIANDLFFLTIGVILGGSVGIATIITAIGFGPIIQFIRERISSPINKWLSTWKHKQSIDCFFILGQIVV